jgi:hypothetical protein
MADTMKGLVQVPLNTPATTNLSGPRATVDSRAAPRLATSLVEDLPEEVVVKDFMAEDLRVVVLVEDLMVESVND